MDSCSMCGSMVPEGQGVCSMCYGDIDFGNDGYYRDWAEQQDVAQAEEAQAEEAEYQNIQFNQDNPPPSPSEEVDDLPF